MCRKPPTIFPNTFPKCVNNYALLDFLLMVKDLALADLEDGFYNKYVTPRNGVPFPEIDDVTSIINRQYSLHLVDLSSFSCADKSGLWQAKTSQLN